MTPGPVLRCAVLTCLLLPAAVACTASAETAPFDAPAAYLRRAVAEACGEGDLSALDLGDRLGATRLLDERTHRIGREIGRWTRRYALPGDGVVEVLKHFPAGRLRRFSIDVYAPPAMPDGGARPLMTAIANGHCEIFTGRRIRYGDDGRAEAIEELGPDLRPSGAALDLNPPVPEGAPDPPGAVRVALFDSGVNYTLPLIAERLARDADGRALGRDHEDGDDRPYDVDFRGSPFFPVHHGTTVASVLLREAPDARLVPFRFPRSDMARMAGMVEDAASAGARIVAMPMGSRNPREFEAFAAAARARPEMLFVVSAGDDGRDLDRTPLYPAAFDLDNMLVVTSSDASGRLAPSANWGAATVELMVPGEQVEVVDHRGARGRSSGTSYAVPSVAALAARLLAANPQWSTAELKAAIVDLAQPVGPEVRHGWIAAPGLL